MKALTIGLILLVMVLLAGVAEAALQGSPNTLQVTAPGASLQGSSPLLQGSSPDLQPTYNPQ